MKYKFAKTKIVFTVLILVIGCESALAQKAFDEYLLEKNFEPFTAYTEITQPSTSADAYVTVNTKTTISHVRTSIFGQNAVAWQGNLNTAATREENWKNAGLSLVRYPGGNWSNIWFWDGNVPSSIRTESTLNGNVGNLKKGSDGWMLGTDEFPDFLEFLDADGMVCVNVGYAFYGTGVDPLATAAQYAADWVEHYNIDNNVGIKYWELGNENYGPWQAGFDLATPQKYAEACVEFATRMKAVDPTIKLGVVLYEGEGGFNDSPQAKDWNEIVLPIVEDIADFLIIHHYPHPNTNQNAIIEDEIYDAVEVVHESYQMIQDQVTTYTSKPAGYYPIATTEFNMRCGIRNMSRANALFTTMMLAEYAKYDYGAVTQWDLQNGFNTETGDHGMVSSRDPFLDEGSVNPEFYAFYYLRRYFGSTMVESESTDNNVISYATTFDSGELGLVVVNRGATDKVVDLSLNDFAKGERVYWHTVEGDESDFDRTIYINGVGPEKSFVVGQEYTSNRGTNDNTLTATSFEENGVSGPQNYTEVLPRSSLLSSGTLKFDAPRYSVSYLVFETAGSDCSIPNLGSDQSLCGMGNVILSTGLSETGLSYSWKDSDGFEISTDAELEVSTAGTYRVEVNNGQCVQGDEITISDEMPLIDLGEDIDLCVETSAILESSVSNPIYSYNWYRDNTFFSNDQSIEVKEPGMYMLELVAAGCESVSDEVLVSSQLPIAKGDTVCQSGDRARLEVLSSGDYSWYDIPTGGDPLSSELIYEPEVMTDQVFYLGNNAVEEMSFGKTDIDGSTYGNTGTGAYESDNRTTILTIEQALILKSVTVFVETNGADLVLNINGDGYSESWSFMNLSNSADGRFVAEINADLKPGTYTLDLIGTAGGIKVQYDQAVQQALEGYASFYTGGGNTDWYGMFFDWRIEVGSTCSRVPVYAVIDEINDGCAITDLGSIDRDLKIYPNPSRAVFYFSEPISYRLSDLVGKEIAIGTGEALDLTIYPDGIYLLHVNHEVFRIVKKR